MSRLRIHGGDTSDIFYGKMYEKLCDPAKCEEHRMDAANAVVAEGEPRRALTRKGPQVALLYCAVSHI